MKMTVVFVFEIEPVSVRRSWLMGRDRTARDGLDLFAGARAELHDRALPELLLDLQDRLVDRLGLLRHCHLTILTTLASERKTAPACCTPAPYQFRVPGDYQSSFFFFRGTSSIVIGWTGAATVFLLSSFSSCSLDFFFAFLSFASPRPVGILTPPVRRKLPDISEHSA